MDQERKVFYVNITIHDASAAVREKVLKYVPQHQSGTPLRGHAIKQRFANQIANFAAEKVPPSQIAARISRRLVKVLPFKMKDLGITVIAEEVFREGEYFVLELQIQHVDMIMLIEAFPRLDIDGDNEKIDLMNLNESELDKLIEEKKTPRQKPSHTRQTTRNDLISLSQTEIIVRFINRLFLAFLGLRTDFFQNKCMPILVHSTIRKSLGKILGQQLKKKKVDADLETFEEAEQARYFYSQVKKVRALKGRNKNKGELNEENLEGRKGLSIFKKN